MVSLTGATLVAGSAPTRIYIPEAARLISCSIQWSGATTVRVGNSTARLPTPPLGAMSSMVIDLHRTLYCGEVWALDDTLAWAAMQVWCAA